MNGALQQIAIFVILFAAHLSFSQTVAVGNCRPMLVSYTTISQAIYESPANSTVLVCPGVYPEQVYINGGVTLHGLTDRAGARPVLTVPRAGLHGGDPSQIAIYSPSAPVVISNLTLEGTEECFAGISDEDTAATFADIEIRSRGCDTGIFLDAGAFSQQSVTVKHCQITGFSNEGVYATSIGYQQFSVSVEDSVLRAENPYLSSTVMVYFAHGKVTNTIAGGGIIFIDADGPAIARGNTVRGSSLGITAVNDTYIFPATITGNHLSQNDFGISVFGVGKQTVSENTISASLYDAIDLGCSPKVLAEGNVIYNSPVGFTGVPPTDVANILNDNSFYKVTTPIGAGEECE